MTTVETIPSLQPVTAFPFLDARAAAELAERLQVERYRVGQVVWRAGDAADSLYLVASGRARVVGGAAEAETSLAVLAPGDAFGEEALLNGSPRAYTVRAAEELVLLRLGREALQELVRRRPGLEAGFERHLEDLAARNSRWLAAAPHPLTAQAATVSPPEGADSPALPDPPVPPSDPVRPTRGRRWPVVYQIGEMDCGAACLVMIGKHYGHSYRLQTMRELAQVGRDGATLRGLAEAAEKIGFRARPVRAALRGLLRTTLPAIAHWGGNHYVVVYHADRRGVLVADPAHGLRRYPEAEFLERWTGLALLVEPGDQLTPSEELPGLLRRFLPLIWPHRRVLMEVLGCSVLLQLFGLASPLFIQVIVDRVVVHRDAGMLNLMLAGMGIVLGFEVLTAAVRQLLLIHAVRRIDVALGVQFLAHLLRLPNRYFERTRIGEILTRFSETENIRRLLTSTALTVLLDMLTIIAYVGIMACYNLGLTLVVVGLILLFALVGLAVTPAFVRNLRHAFTAYSDAQSLLVETIGGVQTVKSVCAERPVRWQWEERLLKYIRLQFQGMNFRLLLDSVGTVMQLSVTTALLWYGARLVMADQLTIGQMMAFLALTGTLMAAASRTVGVWDEVQEARMSLLRLADVLDTEAEEPRGTAAPPALAAVEGHLRFEQVTFRYSEQARANAVENLDLEVLPGQTVALVGRSGCGKSTLVKLVMRLNEPTSGRILVDGQDISKVSVGSWRRQVGAVLQESFLFSGTIRQNIALGHPDAPLEAVQRAAALAGAHDFIHDLPLGYNTLVGEQGASLSGGQRQRISIARALLGDPRILIMDEATSSLDTESERAIQRNFETALRGRTLLVVAHRLSTVRNADRIVVLDRGVVVEQGTHPELMARRGLYFHLCSQQLDQ